jgi:glycerol uptake facilitator-like aquaporin
MTGRDALAFVAAQMAGGIVGVAVANAMFERPLIEASTQVRTGFPLWVGEVVATFGLLVTIHGTLRSNRSALPLAVGCYIGAAYWFTSSTSFANPAVTLARAFSDSFAGIAPASVPGFVLSQIVGALLSCLAPGLRFARPAGAEGTR